MTGGDQREIAGSQETEDERKSTSVPEDKRNSAPATRARFEYQDECIANLVLDHLSGDLDGVLIEHSTDLILIPCEGPPELVSIKHREPHHGVDSGWTWSALKKDAVLKDLYEAWVASERQVTVAFASNAGLSGPAKALWAAHRGVDAAALQKVASRLSKEFKISENEARVFLSILHFPKSPLPRRNEITDVGVRKVEAYLAALGKRAWFAESCYRALVARICAASTDLPDSRGSRSPISGATVRERVAKEEQYRLEGRYISAEELRYLLVSEYERMQAEAAPLTTRTGTVLIRPLGDLDPVIDLGVHVPMRVEGWTELPAYVARTADLDLDQALTAGGFVLIEGNSAAGKSRTGYEGLLRNVKDAGWKTVAVPSSGAVLRDLILTGHDFNNTVVWLDDIEQYVGHGGLDSGIVRTLLSYSNLTILATVRSRAMAELLGASREGLNNSGIRKIFSGAAKISLGRSLGVEERAHAADLREDPRIAAALDKAGEAGFAEYLAAGPAAVERWRNGKHGENEVGAALVSAAVDFRRAGYMAPVPKTWLTATYRHYLETRTHRRTSDAAIYEGFIWASVMVEGASSCLEPVADGERYEVFDYLVDYAQSQRRDGDMEALVKVDDIPDAVWHELADRISLDDPQFMSCVSISAESRHPGLAYAFKNSMRSGQIPTGYFADPERLFNFARSCIAINFCIACKCASLGVDLGILIRNSLESILAFHDSPGEIPDLRQITCLEIFEQFANEGELEASDTMVRNVVDEIPLNSLRKLATVLQREGRVDTAQLWINFIDTRQLTEGLQLPLPGMEK